MADISAIKLPNGTTYNLKDTTARNAANSAVPNTRTVNGKALSSNISLGAGDVGAYTKSETDTKINAAVASTYKYKGSVTADKLPTSGQVVGDVYNITNDSSYGKAGMNVAWNGTTWDALGSNVDLSNYITTSDSRLSNARPASDVYAWAKAENKPSYSWNEITGKPSTYPPSSHTHTKAQVGLGNVANLDQSKAIKSIIRGGTTLTAELDGTNGTKTTKRTTTFTATALDGTTTTFTQQDTNTTYGIATYSADGLMSKTDKAKLDGIGSAGGAVEVTLAAASWSSSTTEINGNNYYTYSVSVANIGNQHPQIFCGGGDSVIPSATQESEFNHIRYALVDTAKSTVTFYSIEKPSVAINVVIKDYLESSIVSGTASVTIATSDWSSTTSTVNGRAFYTAKKTLSSVSSNYPTIICGTADTLPSDAEQTAFDCINYAAADTSTKTVTFYAIQKPTSAVVAIVI